MNNLVILQKPAHLRHRTASLVLYIVIINCMLSALTGCNSKKLALSSPISVTDYKLNTYVQIDSYTNVNKMYYPMLLACVIITNTFSQEPLKQVSFIKSTLNRQLL